jgi:hypothetical protein
VGRKQIINTGAGEGCLGGAVNAGMATQNIWGGLLAFVILAGIVSALRIIQ